MQEISTNEVDETITSAKIAQKQWAKLTVRARGEFLYRWIDELIKAKEDIATTIMNEVGKGYNDALKEIDCTVDFIPYTIEEATHMHGESMLGENFPVGNRSKIAII